MNLLAAGNELKRRHMERMTAVLNWMSSRLPCSCHGNRDKDNGVIKTDSAVIKCHLLASGSPRSIRQGVSAVREKHEQSDGLCVWWGSSFCTELPSHCSCRPAFPAFPALHWNTFTTLAFVCGCGHKLMVALETGDSNKTRFPESVTNAQWGNVKDGIMSHVLSHCFSKHSKVATDIDFWEAVLTVKYVKRSLLFAHKGCFSGMDYKQWNQGKYWLRKLVTQLAILSKSTRIKKGWFPGIALDDLSM